jgi:hypothetical protein
MPVASIVRDVFDHFQNLNLLALLHDLRVGRTTREAWRSGSLLCPLAHGLRAGQQVRELNALGQAGGIGADCAYVAGQLGADGAAVLRFVRSWDDGAFGSTWLVQQLDELWQERLADADLMQQLLQGLPPIAESYGGPMSQHQLDPLLQHPRDPGGL